MGRFFGVIFMVCAILCSVLPATAQNGFRLMSLDFSNESVLPAWCAMPGAGGNNISPELHWTNPPDDTASFALAMIDEHPIARRWVHWIVINIPANVTTLERGASMKKMPEGVRELINSYGFRGYGGPQPPVGTGVHRYVFTIYALKVPQLNIPDRLSAGEFERAIGPYVIEKTSIVGFFKR